MKRWLPVLVLLAVVVTALAIGAARDSTSRSLSARAARIASGVRCPTCEGLSAKESDAPASQAIRDQIKDKLDAGYSDGQIRAYLVDRYGQDILLRPRGTGVSALVWALPVSGGVLALAGLIAVFWRWRRRRRVGRLDEADAALVAAAAPGPEHSEEVNFLLTSLTDLDAERAAGDIDEADYASLRDDYTARAAAALRGPSVVAVERTRPQSRARAGVVILGVVALAALAGVAVARTAGERVPGGAAAGSITDTGPGEKLSRAAALAGQGKLLDAIQLYDQVIKEDPGNAQALAYRGWLVRLAGKQGNDMALIDKGLSYIERAIAADPKYPDAHFFKGEILLRDKSQPADAIPEFKAFLEGGGAPEMASLVSGELTAAQQAVGQH